MAAKAEAAERHADDCTDRPCTLCQRFVCACGKPADGSRRCTACETAAVLAAQLAPTRESVPPHFRWAFDGGGALLAERVRLSNSWVRAAIERPPTGHMVLVGSTGMGKTSLAVAMLDAWVRAAPSTRHGAMFLETGWLSRARARHKLGQDEAPLVEQAMTAPLLVLDDLGGGGEREDRDGCIADVVWTRTNHDRPLWVTTGLAAEGTTDDERLRSLVASLGRKYDGGFARRVVQGSRTIFLGAK